MLAFQASVDIDAKPLPQHNEALGKPISEHAEAFQVYVKIKVEPVALAAVSAPAEAPEDIIPAD